MRTVQAVFDIAVGLMDAQNEATGASLTADTKVYALRTPHLLNSLLDRVYPASTTCSGDGRPVCPKVSTMDDTLDLDERLCCGVLPYGLAGLLLSEEDPARADFFWQTFLEQLLDTRLSLPAEDSAVADLYGGVGGGQYAQW